MRSSSSSHKSLFKILFAIFCALCLALLLRFLIHSYLVFPFVLQQGDMEPNLKKGQRVYVWRLFKHEDLKRGTLVLLTYPPEGTENKGERYSFVRRIIALGGEELSLVKRKVYINRNGDGNGLFELEKGPVWERKIQEYYKRVPIVSSKAGNWDFLTPVRIREGEVFVLADKRMGALDSRLLGSFAIGQIQGIIKE